jgi:hypothetical protein
LVPKPQPVANLFTKQKETCPSAGMQSHPRIPSAPPHDRVYDITIGQHARTMLHIHPQPINPHADIAPTSSGKCEVYIRPVLGCSKGDLAAPRHEQDLACVYQPDGRCTHNLPSATVAALHDRYKYRQEHHPQMHQELKVGTCAEEIHKLVVRHGGKTAAAKWAPVKNRTL